VLGRALNDDDRGVRIAAENGIRSLWCRDGNEEHRHRLGMVIRLNAAKQYEEAIEHAGELIEDAPGFAEVWNQRAIAKFALRRFESAIADCRQVLELNPYHFGAAAGMGQCFAQQRDFGGALDCFRKALRLNPNLEGVRSNIAHLERALETE
jgi:tetratricopeptide (TPR) repeat protein